MFWGYGPKQLRQPAGPPHRRHSSATPIGVFDASAGRKVAQ